jgi:hypothetical protein
MRDTTWQLNDPRVRIELIETFQPFLDKMLQSQSRQQSRLFLLETATGNLALFKGSMLARKIRTKSYVIQQSSQVPILRIFFRRKDFCPKRFLSEKIFVRKDFGCKYFGRKEFWTTCFYLIKIE